MAWYCFHSPCQRLDYCLLLTSINCDKKWAVACYRTVRCVQASLTCDEGWAIAWYRYWLHSLVIKSGLSPRTDFVHLDKDRLLRPTGFTHLLWTLGYPLTCNEHWAIHSPVITLGYPLTCNEHWAIHSPVITLGYPLTCNEHWAIHSPVINTGHPCTCMTLGYPLTCDIHWDILGGLTVLTSLTC